MPAKGVPDGQIARLRARQRLLIRLLEAADRAAPANMVKAPGRDGWSCEVV